MIDVSASSSDNLINVHSSLSDAKWVSQPSDFKDDVVRRQALRLQETHGLHPAMCLYLARKGVFSDEVDTYLDPKLKMLLPEPFSRNEFNKRKLFPNNFVFSKVGVLISLKGGRLVAPAAVVAGVAAVVSCTRNARL